MTYHQDLLPRIVFLEQVDIRISCCALEQVMRIAKHTQKLKDRTSDRGRHGERLLIDPIS